MREDRPAFMATFFKQFFGVGLIDRPVSDEVVKLAWAQAMMAGLRPTLLAAKAFATTDFRPDLPAFTIPTLVIHGTADKTVPIAATAHAVAAAVPHATLVEYEGEAHGVFASQTQRLIEDLLAFMDDQPVGQQEQAALDLQTAQSIAFTEI
jgi:pimeloyl-ACP methyl ester carboxylesterase